MWEPCRLSLMGERQVGVGGKAGWGGGRGGGGWRREQKESCKVRCGRKITDGERNEVRQVK